MWVRIICELFEMDVQFDDTATDTEIEQRITRVMHDPLRMPDGSTSSWRWVRAALRTGRSWVVHEPVSG